jgi:uncharacterized protein (TIGR03435 family)
LRIADFLFNLRAGKKSMISVSRPIVVGLALAAAHLTRLLAAQEPGGPRFEVASVKRNTTGDQPMGLVGGQPGGVTFRNIVLRDLIRRSYRLQEYQVVGGPRWVDAERFDVLAKANGTPSVDAKWAMMRALLAERFGLKAHTETRIALIYRLVRERKDGRLGPQLRRSPSPCVPGQIMPCAVLGISRSGELSARTDPMDDFVRRGLMFLLGATVIDETHLQGSFDIDLKWTPDSPAGPPAPGGANTDSDRPSIFTALREQLGLKLEPSKGPVEYLVIDRVNHPSEN